MEDDDDATALTPPSLPPRLQARRKASPTRLLPYRSIDDSSCARPSLPPSVVVVCYWLSWRAAASWWWRWCLIGVGDAAAGLLGARCCRRATRPLESDDHLRDRDVTATTDDEGGAGRGRRLAGGPGGGGGEDGAGWASRANLLGPAGRQAGRGLRRRQGAGQGWGSCGWVVGGTWPSRWHRPAAAPRSRTSHGPDRTPPMGRGAAAHNTTPR